MLRGMTNYPSGHEDWHKNTSNQKRPSEMGAILLCQLYC